jgi:hypothetical protein
MLTEGGNAKIWKTYKRADKELIQGEFGWVADTEFFDDDAGDYLEIIEETWQLLETRTLKLGNLERWCSICDEDVTLTEPVDGPVYCVDHAEGKPGVRRER